MTQDHSADERNHHAGTIAMFERAAGAGQQGNSDSEQEQKFQEIGEALITEALSGRSRTALEEMRQRSCE